MRDCPSLCAVGVLLTYEYIFRTNMEYHLCGFHCIDSRDCRAWFNLDYATPQSQHVDGSLVMNKLALTAISAILVSLAVVVTLFITTSDSDFGESKKTFADLGGDFTLTSGNGPVSSSEFRGKVVVMYFGFTSCPEVCPNSMGVISNALNRLNKNQLNKTQALLVSIDPNRDSPEELAEYATYYHDNLIGLTGSKQQIDNITQQYGAHYDFTEIESVTGDYGVEHSSRYYVIDQNGKLITAMRHSTTPNELYAQITQLLEKETS